MVRRGLWWDKFGWVMWEDWYGVDGIEIDTHCFVCFGKVDMGFAFGLDGIYISYSILISLIYHAWPQRASVDPERASKECA